MKASRVAMVSVHACPLAKLGGRDSGGMNVYVRELARDLGRRGIEVDVFTRWREKDDPRIQQIATNARVIHIPSGPIGYWPKMAVYEHLDEFTSQLLEYVEAEGRSYDIVHAHYWLSAKVARTLEQRWKTPVVQMFHTLGLVKREVMDEDVDGLYAFAYEGTLALYNAAFDPTLAPLSVGIVCHAYAIRSAIEEGIRTYDLLRGDEPYKYDLGAEDRWLVRIEAARQ
ncbi:MAG: hypothetical protein AUH33_05770 [Chloroflexi bacterium 13_1_40CM_68_21]|nr:MAG: hypothetical protein AUH33_05770 [Chloroflexi bacterium 13_1_40CM_68_21]